MDDELPSDAHDVLIPPSSPSSPSAITIIAISAIKTLSQAKSRITSPLLSHSQKQELVLAMLLDTYHALTPIINTHIIISPDPLVLEFAAHHGLHPLLENLPSSQYLSQTAKLNAALHYAYQYLYHSYPQAYTLIIQPDLPAITTKDSIQLQQNIPTISPGIIQDHHHQGTCVLTLPPRAHFLFHFGNHSAAKHQRQGAQLIPGSWEGLSYDVDTIEDLYHLHMNPDISLGKYTTEIMHNLSLN